MNGMSRVFVGLGLVVMVGFLVTEVLPGIKGGSMENPPEIFEGKQKLIPHQHEGITDAVKEPVPDEQTPIATKECLVGWNNDDFKEGWCDLGEYAPGTYSLQFQSSLRFVNQDKSETKFPPEGLPAKRWSAYTTEWVDFVRTWSPVIKGEDGETMVGAVIIRTNDDIPAISKTMTLTKRTELFASVNYPLTRDNWVKQGLKGKITIKISKK